MEIAVTVTLPGIPEALRELADAIRGSQRIEKIDCKAEATPLAQAEPEPKPEPKPEVVESPLNMEAIETITPDPEPIPEKLPEKVEAETEPVKEYTFTDISNAGAALCAKGLAKINELTALLNTKYGVNAITKLQPSQYAAIAEDLRKMGATL